MPSGNCTDRVVITMDHVKFEKNLLAEYLFSHGASGVIVAMEYHGGTKAEMLRRIADEDDDLTEDNCYHMCAAAYGTFDKKNLTMRGRRWAQKVTDNDKAHWSTAYAHAKKANDGKVTYVKWEFEDMVKYISIERYR